MNSKQLRELLVAAGCERIRQGKGSHEIWYSPITNKTFPVPHPKKSCANRNREKHKKISRHLVCQSVEVIIMFFMVGIEVPKNKNEAWGIVVPVFEKLGLGCVSAVDDETDILQETRDVILSMAEVVLEQGYLLDELSEPYKDYSQEANFDYCQRWLAVDVDLSEVSDEQKRVNISLSAALLARIDATVDANRREYKDRSNFLAVAASHEIHRNRVQA